ncbi:deoxycytidylate deaminase [Caminicella sporogenes]|uniref:deoxycytidylate deaminase n=1 Tax=Caminicella sporogenes TaxID=166485 RepID=UPI0025412023|nr:cytidine/deoxycytidylate deaminase family protein [Caminicella sporogenes]WIF96054.1 cytidine/deoxycytidylate deaminase family protein [Caminicella sporogenes]
MRPDWNHYFMEMAETVKSRSTCLRRKVGAVIVKDKRILATGYNGSPTGTVHCIDAGCLRELYNIPSGQRAELCRGTHAEQNAIVQAAYHGVSVKDSTLYVTLQPCVLCAKMAINAGIKKIYYKGNYPDELALKILDEAGVELIKID